MLNGFVKPKRVTDPLDDKVRAQLVTSQLSYVGSSGSEHSPCLSLSELVHDFLENDSDTESQLAYNSDSERVDSVSDSVEAVETIVDLCNSNVNANAYGKLLKCHVLEAVETFSCLRSNRNVFLRNVMAFLRGLGHNAAVCKTRWESTSGLASGTYEFLDVVQSESTMCHSRYLIDLDFATQFEIARPNEEYSKLVQHSLPRVFIGCGEELRKLVRIMCDVAKRSLRSRELSVPPWRKNRYMQNKWFGPYKRTTNPVHDQPARQFMLPVGGVKCRLVGFDHPHGFFVPTR
ncbi:hypothetical protein ACB092_12G206500 [Castanea dentata]